MKPSKTLPGGNDSVTRRQFLLWAATVICLPGTVTAGWLMTKPSCDFTAPDIIPRAEWGAAQANHDASGEHGFYDPITNPEGWMQYPSPLEKALDTIVIHHSALPHSQGALQMQQLHQQNRGFADIGYHFVIDQQGKLYEGRPIQIRGAHTGGYNTGKIGIVLTGNFETNHPETSQQHTLHNLILYLRDCYKLQFLAGHKDFQPDQTLCPGKNLAVLLPTFARLTNLIYGTG